MIRRTSSVVLPLALLLLLQSQSGSAGSADWKAVPLVTGGQSPGMTEPERPEMRASIVDRDGDQFIAKTDPGDEFRLPVEGAPPDTNVGDVLRLIPDPDTETMNVFKADPADGGREDNPASQL